MNALDHQPPRTARANGIDLCYEIFGDDAAEPMLLIMGLGAQMIHWDDDFCRQLAARGFRVIRFDNRDIGQSSKLTAIASPVLAIPHCCGWPVNIGPRFAGPGRSQAFCAGRNRVIDS